jgi:predicted neuraminidase
MNTTTNTNLNPALVIAGDTKSALSAIDHALLQSAQLFSSALEASKSVPVPIRTSQKLFASLHRNLGAILTGRDEVRQSIAIMHGVAHASGFQEALEGCPDGFPTGAALEPAPSEHRLTV